MPRGKTVSRGKGVKIKRTARVTESDRTAAPSQTEHEVVPPRMQIRTSNAPGPSTMSNSSVDLPNKEEFVMPVYSQNINEQGTFQNFESNVNSVHEIPSISNDLGNNISSNIRQKILNGEYIDLGCVLSNPVPIDDNSNTLIIKDGVLQSKPKASTVKINNISQWTDAFLIFIDIYLLSHLGEARGLLKYMSNIRLGASRVPGLGWKRIGELVVNKSLAHSHTLSLDDFSFSENNVSINLQFSKTDQLGKGSLIIIPSINSHACPVHLLKKYFIARPKSIGPAFIHFDGNYATRYQFNAVLKKALNVANITSDNFQSHSLRIGAAS
ncbi:unnamed protein product [Mytilus coruscus]|uniref:Tyr recombinase domain-containing protein n=1 Tax=Mytilus coruscus TaxID=42192 RepID=A0A6J8BPQ0_MYTCO|nr:unnamed protein product [Mytilus coruscus]